MAVRTPVEHDDPLLALSRRKGMSWRTFVLPDAKLMYVQVNKNACTSLKWMIAGIAGEDLDAFGPSAEASTNRWDDIHDRRQWHHVPLLRDLDADIRREIRPENGWFVFSVTRDPRSRLFSAWQSKLLLDNPGYQAFAQQPWYPTHPVTTESIISDFGRFVQLFEDEPTIGLRRDGHFRDQVEMLHEDLVPYSRLYDIRELGSLVDDLRTHLDGVGRRVPVDLPRHNDTPLRATAAVFGGGLRERVEQLYRADFERFPDRWDFAKIESVPDWTSDELHEVDDTADIGRRLGMLRRAARQADNRAEAAEKRVATLTRQLTDAQRPRPWGAQLRSDAGRALLAARRRVERSRAKHGGGRSS